MDINRQPQQLMADLRKRLTDTKGEWRSLVKATGVPYDTVAKLHQGVTENPRLCTFVPLMQALQRHEQTGMFDAPRKPRRQRPTQAAAQPIAAAPGA